MAFRHPKAHEGCSCEVQLSAGEIDAGADVELAVRAACPKGCDLSGLTVTIRDAEGSKVASVVLAAADEEGWFVGESVFEAPSTAGEHRFEAVLDAPAHDGIVHRSNPSSFVLTVKPHATRVNVWDLPAAVVAGEWFSFKVGVKCSAACNRAGHAVSLVDGEGTEVAAVRLAADVWPGTTALYFAEVKAKAPTSAGSHEWELVVPERHQGVPHARATTGFILNVVVAPEAEITVEAVDREQQLPIKGARVVLHPYRSVTDEAGVARIRVARGEYRLLVSGAKYLPSSQHLAVDSDLVARAELDREPPEFNPDDAY